jgi:hypothetical protein
VGLADVSQHVFHPNAVPEGRRVSAGSTKKLTVTLGRKTCFWKIVSKTMAGKTASGPVWSFGT